MKLSHLTLLSLLAIFVASLASSNSYWVCDKTDSNWNCNSRVDEPSPQPIVNNITTENNITTDNNIASDNNITTDNTSIAVTGTEAKRVSFAQPSSQEANGELNSLSLPRDFPADSYSVQLLASGSKDRLVELIKKYNMPSLVLKYETSERILYLWLSGSYTSKAEAEAALNELPELETGLSPWVRNTANLADMPVILRARL